MVVAALGVAAAPAYASCADDSGPAGSPVVFVGTPVEDRGGHTKFEVTEVWEGPDLAPEVWLLTGQEQPPWPLSLLQSVGSSNDATLVSGDSYVIGATEAFTTNDCTIGSPDGAASLRPEDPREPVDSGTDGVDPPPGPVAKTLSVAGVLGALAAVVVALRRRRARPDSA